VSLLTFFATIAFRGRNEAIILRYKGSSQWFDAVVRRVPYFFFIPTINFNIYIMTFLSKRKVFEVQMGTIGILNFFLKKWIFPFFISKIWETVQFHLLQKFCSVSFRWGSQGFYETTGLEPIL
jgi:hypothetical protein